MSISLATFTATVGGKILLGSAATAVVLGGAQVTGAVDILSSVGKSAVNIDAGVGSDNGEVRVDVQDAGSLGVWVKNGELRLSDISAADDWNGLLISQTATTR